MVAQDVAYVFDRARHAALLNKLPLMDYLQNSASGFLTSFIGEVYNSRLMETRFQKMNSAMRRGSALAPTPRPTELNNFRKVIPAALSRNLDVFTDWKARNLAKFNHGVCLITQIPSQY